MFPVLAKTSCTCSHAGSHLRRPSQWRGGYSSSRSWWDCWRKPVRVGRGGWGLLYCRTTPPLVAMHHPWLKDNNMYTRVKHSWGWLCFCLRVEELRNSGILLSLNKQREAFSTHFHTFTLMVWWRYCTIRKWSCLMHAVNIFIVCFRSELWTRQLRTEGRSWKTNAHFLNTSYKIHHKNNNLTAALKSKNAQLMLIIFFTLCQHLMSITSTVGLAERV